MDTNEQCKDVYAHFGLALDCAQCLEQAIIIQIMLMDHMPKSVSKYQSRKDWENSFDNFMDDASSKTMGKLLKKLQQLGVPSEELSKDLRASLEKRNWLAHNYFPDRALEFMNEKGRLKMVSELTEIRAFFQEVEDKINSITDKLSLKFGLTKEVREQIEWQMLNDANSDL